MVKKMSNIFLYAHGGSGNHGCEAIVRSTAKILGKENITLISSAPEQDLQYGIGDVCGIIKDKNSAKKDFDFIKAYLALKVKHNYIPLDKLEYKQSFSNIKKDDIALSIGGDNYCYADVNKYVMLHDMLKKRGAKTVLWGCSVEPSLAEIPDIAADLSRYDLITARETITYEALRKINKNTILVSDPAFQLDIKETSLPNNFIKGNTVGINISPMAIETESVDGIALKNCEELVDYIIKSTDMNGAFIPHVVWKDGDDREPLNKLYNKYKSTGRVCIVEDRGCMELKYIISNCRFFIGARTHATIAAYSTCVPTFVLGYSVKSRGIARDIFGTEDGYVMPVKDLKETNTLTNCFMKMLSNEKAIKDKLQSVMPEYIEKSLKAGEALKGLL